MSIILFLLSINSSYFLKISPGVMAQGLGGSSVMIDEGLSAFHNPAIMHHMQFNFTLARWLYSTNLFSFSASLNDNAIGISYLSYGGIQGFDEFGDPTHKFTPYNLCVAIARKIGPFGIAVKSFIEKIDAYTLYGICGSVGTVLDFKAFSIGAKVDNLGKEFSKSTVIPFTAALGLKFGLPKNLDYYLEANAPDIEINSGLLYGYRNINILLGLKYLKSKNFIGNTDYAFDISDLDFTGGLIIKIENYHIGYSVVYDQFSMAHQFSIILNP